ncbi:MAG TPA: class I SAM-dependent methyltransferase [Trebonia sp.]|jgi:predicted O-methyltransferase YrrM|nr:class I SAM-dependent methyltransferase [Trebonia sp.]
MAAPEEVPPLAARARALATEVGFALTREEALREAGDGDGDKGAPHPSASLPGVGRFLAMLAAGCAGGLIGELGTGTGVGAAWIVSAMPADARLITVEIDPERAAAARGLFAGDPRVRVLTGDSLDLIAAHAPFDLLFADGGVGDRARLVDLLAIGGRIVADDVTPQAALPPDSPFRDHDPKREFFFGDPRLVSVEVVLPDLRNSLLVGTRTR